MGRGCVAFYPRLADLTGSVTAALLLGQCLYWTRSVLRQQPERDGWFWKTSAEWQRETGLSRREQDSARRRLRALGLLTERRRGMPAKRWFRLDLAALGQHLGRAPGSGCGGWPWDDADLARGLGQPVVYWRRLHDLTGSVTAALYLSRALFWQRLALQQAAAPWRLVPSTDLPEPAGPAAGSPATGACAGEPAGAGIDQGACRLRAATAAADPPRTRGAGPTSGGHPAPTALPQLGR